MLQSESERIALVRTIAPLVWAFIVTRIADWGINIDNVLAERATDWLGVDVGVGPINSILTVLVGVALWLVARQWPALFERVLMIIPVKDYAYTRPDNTLVTPNGQVTNAGDVLDIPPGGVHEVDTFTTAFLNRHPSVSARRAAAARILAGVDEVE